MPADLLDNSTAMLEEAAQTGGGMGGVSLALVGGFLYALGALIVSYATKAKGWSSRRVKVWSGISWCALNSGGLCVTFAYQSGASVPLMNAIVYSTNLTLNMLLQMAFELSNYTKTMRCGTILFALVALLLGEISPAPHKVSADMLAQPSAVMWSVVFIFLWAFSGMMVLRVKSLPSGSSVKIMAWALFIACWGSFTDNWAKINGTFDPSSTMYWMLFAPYMPTGAVVMVLSVCAMAATDVALYVPANLCLQLILNVLSGLFLWGDSARIPSMLSYMVGYTICCLAVYISTPEMDLGASLAKAIELQRHELSKLVARTAFGKSVLSLLSKWQELHALGASASSDESLTEQTKQSLEKALVAGVDTRAFSEEHLVQLTTLLWQKSDPCFGPSAATVAWLRDTPYFRDYLARDPAFGDALAEVLPWHEREALHAAVAQKDQKDQAVSVAMVAEGPSMEVAEGPSMEVMEADRTAEV